jgi:hypothetical protein
MHRNLRVVISLLLSSALISTSSSAAVPKWCTQALQTSAYIGEKVREVSTAFTVNWANHVWTVARYVYLGKPEVQVKRVSVSLLKPVHTLNESSSSKSQSRSNALKPHQEEVFAQGFISPAQMAAWIPSVTPIRAVEDTDGTFLLIEGTGRVQAIKEAFAEIPNLEVEIEIYKTSDPDLTLRKLHEDRARYGVSD